MIACDWITRPRPNASARLRLICFPYCGGSDSIFRRWPARLPEDVELCAVQLPGRTTRLAEPPFTRLGELIETVTPILRPYLDKPFALFGHSLGAFMCFEVTRRLRREMGPAPLHLFVSGQRAPHLPIPGRQIHQLDDAAFVEEMNRRYNGIPDELLKDTSMLRVFLGALRADFTMFETYTYRREPPLECPITAFGGLRDNIREEDLAAWREHTRGPFSLRMFDGGHFFLDEMQEPLLEAVSAQLSRPK